MSDEPGDVGEDVEPWTADGAARLLAAAAAAQAAVAAHAEAVATADGDLDAVLSASDELLPALLAYEKAQFDLTGSYFPFALGEFEDEEGGDGEDEWPTSGISVLQRRDYVVADEEAVLAAGRDAYLRVWPDDTEADAAADVTDLGRALYQLAHADGWDNLRKVDGLDPVAGIIGVVKQDAPLGPEPDDWADELLDDDADVIFLQSDVFRP